MKPILSLSLIAALLLGASVGSKASVLVSFETGEGFNASSRTNSAGWTFSNDNRIRVSNGTSEPAHSGSLSVYTQGGAVVSAVNRSLASAGDKLNAFTISTISPTTSWANSANTAWIYVWLWDETAQIDRPMSFLTRYGSSESDAYRLGYSKDNGSGGVSTEFASLAQSAIDFTEWNTFSLVFDFENRRYTLNLNGNALVSNIALPDSWDVTAVVGTWLVSPGNANTTTYYDSLSITSIPEPSTTSTLALGGAVGLAILAMRTRRLKALRH